MPASAGPPDDRFRALFDHASDAMLIFDHTGIIDCNPAAVAFLRAASREAVLAVHPAVLSPEVQPDGRRSADKAAEMDALARSRGVHRFEWVHRRLDGEDVPVAVTLNPVQLGGRPAMIVVWHDLTDIKRAEAELRRRAADLEAANGRLRRDLQAAARVQQALLPAALPAADPVRLAWTYRPCDELAGDLLGVFPLDHRRVGLYLLDVSGHGVPASLLAVTVSHLLAPGGDGGLVRRADGPVGPAEVLRRLNARLCSDRAEQFVTVFYGVLDFRAFTLGYANAGHPPPLVLSAAGRPVELTEGGLPVGVADGAEYDEAVVALSPGDRFWLYSDGLTEAMSPAGDGFGRDRLLAALRATCGRPITEAVRDVLREVEEWAGPGGPQDDISVVAFEVAAG